MGSSATAVPYRFHTDCICVFRSGVLGMLNVHAGWGSPVALTDSWWPNELLCCCFKLTPPTPPTRAGSGSGHMDTSSLFFLYLHSSQKFTVHTVFPTSCCLSPTIQAAHPPLCLHPPFSACHAFFIPVHSLTSFILHTASPRSTLLRVVYRL